MALNLTTFDKALVAGVGGALLVLNNLGGFNFGPDVTQYINLAIAVLTPIAVFLKANKPAITPVPSTPASKV